jgi:hypothetical protein
VRGQRRTSAWLLVGDGEREGRGRLRRRGGDLDMCDAWAGES